ncbi:unnamed protein product, partial [Allacma fusca]
TDGSERPSNAKGYPIFDIVSYKCIYLLFNETDFLASLSILMPWMNNVSRRLSGYDKIMKNTESLKIFLQNQINIHRADTASTTLSWTFA